MFKLLMVALGALFIAGFVKYTVLIHQAWAEEEGERLGLDAISRGIGTMLRGHYRRVPLWLALSGRRVTEGEAKLRPGLDRATVQEFVDAKALFGNVHFKRDAVWANFPRSKPDDDPEPYAAALVTVARFASTRSLEQIYEIEERLEAGMTP
ncbi:MAG TPA: hypothetical protein ENK57_18755, partial [Polyangiaceae bacterium]|nr:hypothetical protein [Polyangiaceae bacterium]